MSRFTSAAGVMAGQGDDQENSSEGLWKVFVKVLAAVLAVSGGSFALITFQGGDSDHSGSQTVTMDADGAAGGGQDGGGGKVASVTQDVHGAGSQDHSRRVHVVFNDFRMAAVRGTDALPEPKQDHRDRVLTVIADLLAAADAEPTKADADRLGRELATVIEQAPISRYQLTGEEFTLQPGTAYFLPGTDDAVALVGPRDVSDPNSVYVRRNGRKTPMNVGSVWTFRRPGEECRLVLHEVAENHAAATFSFGCAPTAP